MPDRNQYIVTGPSQEDLSGNLDISVGAYYKNRFDEIISNEPDAVAFVSSCLVQKTQGFNFFLFLPRSNTKRA